MLVAAIIATIVLNGSAQLLIRSGMKDVDVAELIGHRDLAGIISTAISIQIIGGIACYGLSVLTWMYVLSQMSVGIAYPFISLAFVFVVVVGVLFLGESVGVMAIIGLALVVTGITLLARSV
jgi:multidrug transporter EmrE-like cation transporter